MEKNLAAKLAYVKDLRTRPLAIATKEANEQHYEVPAPFYDVSALIERSGLLGEEDSRARAEVEHASLQSLPLLTLRYSSVSPTVLLSQSSLSPALFPALQTCLGPLKKYSCGIWGPGINTLAESEEAALAMVCERAQITNTE